MLDKFDDLFVELHEEENMDKLFKEKLGIGFEDCAQALCESLKNRAGEIVEDLLTVAPHGDYDKLLDAPEKIIRFLQDEASKIENWQIYFISVKKTGDQLIELIFHNKAIDDGDILKGFVFVGLSGKIRHAFCQAN